MKTADNFEQYGPEWVKEVMKMPKSFIIDKLLKPALMERSETMSICSGRQENEVAEVTVGKLLTDAMNLHELDVDIFEKEIGLPNGIMTKLMKDEFYTNSVPVVLFKNLIISLHIPIDKVLKAIPNTFKVVASKETPESIRKKPHGYMLWENKEALKKYTDRLASLFSNPLSQEEQGEQVSQHLSKIKSLTNLYAGNEDAYHELCVKILGHLQQQPFRASLEYFLEKGSVNGNFYIALMTLRDEILKNLPAPSVKEQGTETNY